MKIPSCIEGSSPPDPAATKHTRAQIHSAAGKTGCDAPTKQYLCTGVGGHGPAAHNLPGPSQTRHENSNWRQLPRFARYVRFKHRRGWTTIYSPGASHGCMQGYTRKKTTATGAYIRHAPATHYLRYLQACRRWVWWCQVLSRVQHTVHTFFHMRQRSGDDCAHRQPGHGQTQRSRRRTSRAARQAGQGPRGRSSRAKLPFARERIGKDTRHRHHQALIDVFERPNPGDKAPYLPCIWPLAAPPLKGCSKRRIRP